MHQNHRQGTPHVPISLCLKWIHGEGYRFRLAVDDNDRPDRRMNQRRVRSEPGLNVINTTRVIALSTDDATNDAYHLLGN